MLDKYGRKYVQPAADFFGAYLVLAGLTPAFVTAIAFVSGLLAAVCIALCKINYALIFMWLSGFLDLLDGTVARLSKKIEPFGAYIDLISDRMVESAIIIGFAVIRPDGYFAYIIFLVAVLFHFSTFVVAGALFKNTGQKSMYYDHSLVERAEAFVVFTLLLLFPVYLYQILMIFNIFIFWSGAARFIRVAQYAQSANT